MRAVVKHLFQVGERELTFPIWFHAHDRREWFS